MTRVKTLYSATTKEGPAGDMHLERGIIKMCNYLGTGRSDENIKTQHWNNTRGKM